MPTFKRGNRFGRGRPKGSPNRATVIGRSMLELLERGDDRLPPADERWRALLTDRDPAVRLSAEKFLFVALPGLPHRMREVLPDTLPIRIIWEDRTAPGLPAVSSHVESA